MTFQQKTLPEETGNKAATYHITLIFKLAQQQNHTADVYFKQENNKKSPVVSNLD